MTTPERPDSITTTPCAVCDAVPKSCPGCLANPGELGPIDPNDTKDPWF